MALDIKQIMDAAYPDLLKAWRDEINRSDIFMSGLINARINNGPIHYPIQYEPEDNFEDDGSEELKGD